MIDEVRRRYSWERILLDSDLETSAKCLGLAIATYTSPSQPGGWPAVETLAADISRSPRTVQRLLRVLTEAGFLATEERYSDAGRQLSTMYVLTAPRAREGDTGDATNPGTSQTSPEPDDTHGAEGENPDADPGEGDTGDTPGGDTGDTLTDQRNRTGTPSLRSGSTGERSPAQELVAWWVDRQAFAPSRTDIGKQAGVAKRLLDRYGMEAVRVGVAGMAYLYPYSKGEPWDLFDLERKMLKAAQALAASSPKFKRAREKDRILDSIRRAGQSTGG